MHSDLWGLAQVPSLSGGKYFMTLIDDNSRNIWLYIVKTNDQPLQKFKIWKAIVENYIGLQVKVLKTDNGLEFHNKEFVDYS